MDPLKELDNETKVFIKSSKGSIAIDIEPINLKCKECGKIFLTGQKMVRRGRLSGCIAVNNRWCSKECLLKWASKFKENERKILEKLAKSKWVGDEVRDALNYAVHLIERRQKEIDT